MVEVSYHNMPKSVVNLIKYYRSCHLYLTRLLFLYVAYISITQKELFCRSKQTCLGKDL